MRTKGTEKKVETIVGRLRDVVGLPTGDKTPYGEGRPPLKDTTPEGGLTSPDAKGLPPHGDSGLKPE